jgi:hypothetical protein
MMLCTYDRFILHWKKSDSNGGTGKNLPKEKCHTATCYRSGDWGSIPCKILSFLITSLVVSQGSSFTVDICRLVLVSFTGYKTKNRVLHCLAYHFIS